MRATERVDEKKFVRPAILRLTDPGTKFPYMDIQADERRWRLDSAHASAVMATMIDPRLKSDAAGRC